MAYLLAGGIYFLLHSFLILATNLIIFPEVSFFSWLIHKGFIPYRDFFDHHGFLLYVLLAPLSGSPSTFIYLKIFYFILQSGILLLFLIILQKITNRLGFLYGGIIYVLLNFITSENTIWYETLITPLLLLVYFLLIQKKAKNVSLLLGFFIGIASFIKPVAFVFLIPTIIFSRKMLASVTTLLCWGIVFFYFFVQNTLRNFINNVIQFNIFLLGSYQDTRITYPKLMYAIGLLILGAVLVVWRQKKLNTLVLTGTYMLFSLIFQSTGLSGPHALPFITFFALFISQVAALKPSRGKKLFLLGVLFFIFFLSRKTYYQFNVTYKQRIPWQTDSNTQTLINALKSIRLDTQRVYVFSNHVEVYQSLDQIPPTYYPVLFPLIGTFDTNLETRIITDIQDHNVQLIVFPKPQTEEFSHLLSLQKYILENYQKIIDTQSFTIFKKVEEGSKLLSPNW